jgi:hypothetical protein
MIRFHKRKRASGKDTLICVREDGSETVARIPFPGGPVHDLCHYAVETVLGFTNAFYGLVAAGRDIGDFDVAGAGQMLKLPYEAGLVEHIVGIFQYEITYGETYAEFNAQLTAEMRDGTPPRYSNEDVARVRALCRELLERWRAVEAGGVMELAFPADPRSPSR